MSTGGSVLVLGGAGYIGSHMVDNLLRHGERVVVLDNLRNGRRDLVLTPDFVEGDIEDGALLDQIFRSYQVTDVMHFAALIEVGESVKRPLDFLDNNVRRTQVVLDTMARHGVDRLVFSSTAAVYGIYEGTGSIPETAPTDPVNPYGVSKLLAEQMIAAYGRALGLRAMVFRYFNAAGADPGGRLGECHEPETHLIPLVLQAASGRRPEILIYGTDYPTPDGTCIRDYVHVTDLCEAHRLGLRALRDGAGSAVYNLGSESGFSVREVIDTTKRVTGTKFRVVEAPRRKGDSLSLIADASRAAAALGWAPQRSDLETIILDAWRWEQRCIAEVQNGVKSRRCGK